MSLIDDLRLATRNGNNEQVQQLIAKGADIHERDALGWTALHRATANGHIAVMTTLIQAGADINSEEDLGRTPIYCACQNGLLPAVNLLIENRANVNRQRKNGRSPLYAAAANGYISVVKALVSAGAVVDLPSGTGCSPLYAATQEGHVAVVEYLIGAGADANRQSNDGSTALHVASWCGRAAVVQSLIDAKVNVDAQDASGKTPLHEASVTKNVSVIQMLIDAGADVNRQDNMGCTPLFFAITVACQPAVRILLSNGARPQIASLRPPFSPLQVACFIGSGEITKAILQHSPHAADRLPASCTSLARECAEKVPEQASPKGDVIMHESRAKAQNDDVTDTQLSNSLHSQFKKAGFTCQMSAFQSACGDVMQQIEQKRRKWEDIFVVGSFSEGWGNSLSRLIGKTDVESDIDVAEFFPGRKYHIRGRCQCENVKEEDLVNYDNGHVMVTGLTNNPALPEYGSCLRPAFDYVTAYRCCSYPHVEVVENPNPNSHLSDSLLESLAQCVRESNCHLVTAAPPGQGGQLLRVSTTFLERLTLRSLSDVQGQLFILLKYLIKKVLSETVSGLKTYHAKSLLFYMLDETAPENWKPANLVALARQALQLLLRHMMSSDANGSECMRHFFMRDAIVYFKSGHSPKEKIKEAINGAIGDLPRHVARFKDFTLKPVDRQPPTFYFHPFMNIPWIRVIGRYSLEAPLQYHEIYDCVRDILVLLAQKDTLEQKVTDIIDRLPDCAKNVRETLRAIAYIKHNKKEQAIEVLHSLRGHSVSRRINSADVAGQQTVTEFVWRHLTTSDSAWKFCFFINERPDFHFLGQFIARLFPVIFNDCHQYFFFNFDALKMCLMLDLVGDAAADAKRWFEEILLSEDADVQEMIMVMHHCRDIPLLLSVLRKHNGVLLDHHASREKLLELMEELPELQEQRCLETLQDLRARLVQ